MCTKNNKGREEKRPCALSRNAYVPLSFGISKRTRAIGESRFGTKQKGELGLKIDRVTREDLSLLRKRKTLRFPSKNVSFPFD